MGNRTMPQSDHAGRYLTSWFVQFRAAMAAMYEKRRRALSGQSAGCDAVAELKAMGWQEFESLIGDAFRLQGFMVAQRGGNGPDGEVDLVLSKSSEIYLVQCKQWRAPWVDADVVQALHQVMVQQRAVRGYVVTAGNFTTDAQALAQAHNVHLIDGDKLMEMLRLARVSQGIQASANASASAAHGHSPACPICNAAMIVREAKYGDSAGHKVWSCTQFPHCHGTRELQG